MSFVFRMQVFHRHWVLLPYQLLLPVDEGQIFIALSLKLALVYVGHQGEDGPPICCPARGAV